MKETENRKAELATARIFNTPDGVILLDYLRSITIEQTNIPQANDGGMMSILMGIKEGENNLYRKILLLKKKGEQQ
jgi:hypothetical protein